MGIAMDDQELEEELNIQTCSSKRGHRVRIMITVNQKFLTLISTIIAGSVIMRILASVMSVQRLGYSVSNLP